MSVEPLKKRKRNPSEKKTLLILFYFIPGIFFLILVINLSKIFVTNRTKQKAENLKKLGQTDTLIAVAE